MRTGASVACTSGGQDHRWLAATAKAGVGGVPLVDRPVRPAAEFYGKGNDEFVYHPLGLPAPSVHRHFQNLLSDLGNGTRLWHPLSKIQISRGHVMVLGVLVAGDAAGCLRLDLGLRAGNHTREQLWPFALLMLQQKTGHFYGGTSGHSLTFLFLSDKDEAYLDI